MSKERQRYYLLPGMGGSAMRRKRRIILCWSLLAGILVSAAAAWALFWLQTLMRRGGGEAGPRWFKIRMTNVKHSKEKPDLASEVRDQEARKYRCGQDLWRRRSKLL